MPTSNTSKPFLHVSSSCLLSQGGLYWPAELLRGRLVNLSAITWKYFRKYKIKVGKWNITYKELQTYPSFLAIVTLKIISHLYMLGKASPMHKQQWGLDTCLIRGPAMGVIIQYHHNQRDICQYTTPILTQHASINCYRHFLRCNAIMIVSIQCKRVEFLAWKAVTKACSR